MDDKIRVNATLHMYTPGMDDKIRVNATLHIYRLLVWMTRLELMQHCIYISTSCMGDKISH